jgi:putative membrane protein
LIKPYPSPPEQNDEAKWYLMSGRSTGTILVIVLLIGLLVVLPMFGMWMWAPMMGRGMMGGYGYPYGMGRGGWGFMFAGMLIPLLFVILVIVGAYLWLTSRKEPAESGKAIAILDERYAKGEITKEQYLEMKEHLSKK